MSSKAKASSMSGARRLFFYVMLDAFAVMPNQLHGSIMIRGRGTARRGPTQGHGPTERRIPTPERFGKPVVGSIPTIIRSFKSACTKRIDEIRETPGVPVWL
jgi:putative transposase